MFLISITMYSSESLGQNAHKLHGVNDKCINALAQDYMYLWKYTNKDYRSKITLFYSIKKKKKGLSKVALRSYSKVVMFKNAYDVPLYNIQLHFSSIFVLYFKYLNIKILNLFVIYLILGMK